MRNRLSDITLRELCIQNQWFTGGSNRQYEKMFQRASEGATLEELALIIWLCSNASRAEIESKLCETQKTYLTAIGEYTL